MTQDKKIETVQTLVGNDNEATANVVAAYLLDAQYAIFNRMHPMGAEADADCFEVPLRYEFLQCKLAARYFNRRGAEGEIIHLENGISRTYGSVNDEDLLSEVIQVVKL